jgi:hypothetical protein
MKTLPYIDPAGHIDVPGLQQEINLKLQHLKDAFEEVLQSRGGRMLMVELKNVAGLATDLEERQQAVTLIHQLEDLPTYIAHWRQMSVDSEPRFDFFVKTKAEELRSGSETGDFLEALNCRYDQLVGLIRVLTALLMHLKRFTTMPIETILEDPVFAGLIEHDLEAQVYLEAEKVYIERLALGHTG